MINMPWRHSLLAGVCLSVATQVAQAQTVSFNIPAGDMKAALEAYISQSGQQLVFSLDDIRSEKSRGVQACWSATRPWHSCWPALRWQ